MRKLKNKTWRKVKLGEVCFSASDSFDFKKNSKFIFINTGDIENGKFVHKSYFKNFRLPGQAKKAIKENDILYSEIRPQNKHFAFVNFRSDEFVVSTKLMVIRSNKKIDPVFLYLYLTNRNVLNDFQIIAESRSGTFPQLTFESIADYPIMLPSITEQKRIASILSAFDDKIELNNKINQNLEQTAQAIFKEWFVKFKFPGYEKAKIIDSELGKIPEGWSVGKINDLISVVSGYPFSSKLYGSSKKALGVVTIKNVQDGNFVKTCDSFIIKEDLPSRFNHDYFLRDGDILLSLTGNVGRVCFVYGGEYLLNQRVAKLKPKNPKDFAFCYFLFRHPLMQNYLINMAKGSAQPNLSPIEVGKIQWAIPSKKILDKYNKFANSIYQQLVKNAVESQKLAALRDLLLPKLMSGEIRV